MSSFNPDSPNLPRRKILKYAGLTGATTLSGVSALSLASQPALALSEPVQLPSGLTEWTVDVSSYELQYANLETTSDITIKYILGTNSGTQTESHTVSITGSTGAVITGSHSINVPSGEVTLQIQLEHPSIRTVTTQESTPTTIASGSPDSVVSQFTFNNEPPQDSLGSLSVSQTWSYNGLKIWIEQG